MIYCFINIHLPFIFPLTFPICLHKLHAIKFQSICHASLGKSGITTNLGYGSKEIGDY